jgi:hypothetical protein
MKSINKRGVVKDGAHMKAADVPIWMTPDRVKIVEQCFKD